MKTLVIGSGGREHAIVRGLKLSPSVTEVHVIPGSDGMAKDATCHQMNLSDKQALQGFAKRKDFDLVVVGPEVPLAEGLADTFREIDIPCFGPNAAAAQLEASKVFSKEFMVRAEIPTARFHIVDSVEKTLDAAKSFNPPYVLKADGLAAGKGVSISQDLGELSANAKSLFEDKIFGEAGAKALLEEFQPGWELSYLILTDGSGFVSMPGSQDHKRLKEKDLGPNTGGMGTVAPVEINEDLKKEIDEKVVANFLKELNANSEMVYRGVLYIGLMITPDGPSVIEFNVRFGDPEAQVLFPLLDGDWGQTLLSIAKGELPPVKWKEMHTACVVLAASGYPESPVKGAEIIGDVFRETATGYFLHAGTKKNDEKGWVTSGGRVLNAVGTGLSLQQALDSAYDQARSLDWKGVQMRSDIGEKILALD